MRLAYLVQICQPPHLKRVSQSQISLKKSKATATCLMLIVGKAEMERKGSVTEKNSPQKGEFYILCNFKFTQCQKPILILFIITSCEPIKPLVKEEV